MNLKILSTPCSFYWTFVRAALSLLLQVCCFHHNRLTWIWSITHKSIIYTRISTVLFVPPILRNTKKWTKSNFFAGSTVPTLIERGWPPTICKSSTPTVNWIHTKIEKIKNGEKSAQLVKYLWCKVVREGVVTVRLSKKEPDYFRK